MSLFDQFKEQIKGQNLRLVFPEGEDSRVLRAAVELAAEGLVHPIVLGDTSAIQAVAKERDLTLDQIEIIDLALVADSQKERMAQAIVERRNGKTDEKTAYKWLKDVNYFGTMLVQLGDADGMVSGASHPTGDTVRPALQLIKTAPGSRRISGAFIMQKGDQRFVFADCAINIDIDAETMAQIAVQSARTAKVFGIDPKMAMLSFSTKGSAKAEQVDKVVQATKLAKELAPELADKIDGDLQFDAAVVERVAQAKAPDSAVAGQANVFVFPSLEAGNIGYKIAQRLGGFEAIGPILQGLAKPVSDLSRGASKDDVVKVAIITAAQALAQR
ncbi:phosphate acetyltransferase [Fructobacillus pseudoficulneus]|uniref:Phosphate acetyltransferase n=1 Tax=Fructobacillus pseudoficulneus TaxID=220714 RepID=A0A3F3H7M6_9LACO|nr:phosphate acetyltransferase [Fructobacillus pseudoficulneus]GAP02719.1 phosphate acetyltransferase [Fructobacillus pseudoficulneus]SEH39371.1 phosphate acetyltransferase [Fructobacillus pseudoficulneus]